MKKTFLLMLGLLAMMQGLAQNEVGSWTFIPKAGMNWVNRTESEIYVDANESAKVSYSMRRRLTIGVETEYQVTSFLGLSGGVLYSQKGIKYDDMAGLWKSRKLSLDYIDIPLMVHGYIAPHLGVQAGVQPSFLIHKKMVGEDFYVEGNTAGYRKVEDNDLAIYRTFDIGIPVGVSYDLDRVRVEFRYCFGLYDTTKYSLKERNNVAQFTIGYRL